MLLVNEPLISTHYPSLMSLPSPLSFPRHYCLHTGQLERPVEYYSLDLTDILH